MSADERRSHRLREAPARRGCLFWGCATVGLVVFIVAGSVAISVYLLRRALEDFSSGEAVEVAIEPPAPGELESALDKVRRVEEIAKAPPVPEEPAEGPEGAEGPDGEEGEPGDGGPDTPAPDAARPVVITPDDLNSLIAEHPRAESLKLRGRLRVRGEENELLFDLSWPLDEIPGLPISEKRWFNGTVRARVRFDSGDVSVEVVEGIAPDGEKLPDWVLELFGDAMTRDVNRRLGPLFENLNDLEIRGGELRLDPKPRPGPAPDDADGE